MSLCITCRIPLAWVDAGGDSAGRTQPLPRHSSRGAAYVRSDSLVLPHFRGRGKEEEGDEKAK